MITVNTNQFRHAISLAASVVEVRNTIPILGTMKMTANGKLTIEGSDLDCTTHVTLAGSDYSVPAKQAEIAFALCDPERVRTALSHTRAPTLGITDANNGVRFRSGDFIAEIKTLPADDFPEDGGVHFLEASASFGASELRQLARITPAISTEETRYFLNGVCITKRDEGLYRFAATDGHRLMFVDIPLPDLTGTIPDGTIIPKAFLAIALRHFPSAKGGARLTYGRTVVRNSGEGIIADAETLGKPRIAMAGTLGGLDFVLTSKLIDGTYPDINRVIPTGHKLCAHIDCAALAEAVRCVSSLSSENMRAVKLTFSPDHVEVSLNNCELGEGTWRMAAEHNLAPGAIVGMNARYLLDCLGAFTGPVIELHLGEGSSDMMAGQIAAPILFRDPADTTLTAVLTPMRV